MDAVTAWIGLHECFINLNTMKMHKGISGAVKRTGLMNSDVHVCHVPRSLARSNTISDMHPNSQ